jgi:hypothetical protein
MSRRRVSVALFLLFCFANVFLSSAAPISRGLPTENGIPKVKRSRTEQAYATLLYGDEFLLGVRVLGKSLRDTGVTKDMVALVSDGVSDAGIRLLQADGWIVQRIELLANPNSKRPTRFWGVYTKLKIFNMTDYRKVVYLDADTIVTRSIEDLFACQGFCANLKHSERLNSGVMVVEPSSRLFEDMLSKVQTTYSYTGGDQGFLNSYYVEFADADIFNPDLSPEIRQARPKKMERLSTLYNADVGLFALANKWMVDASELRVIHYTLGPLKPWDWYTAWLLEPVKMWQDIRITLEENVPGTGQGRDPHRSLIAWSLFLFPLLVLCYLKRVLLLQIQKDLFGLVCSGSVFLTYARQLWYKYKPGATLPSYSTLSAATPNGCKHQGCTKDTSGKAGLSCIVPKHLGISAIAACFFSLFVALGLSALLIPKQVMPWTGILLVYEWTCFTFLLMFWKYLDYVHSWGRITATKSLTVAEEISLYSADKLHSKNAVSWDPETCTYGIVTALVALLIPALPRIFGTTAIFGRAGLMVSGGFLLAVVATYSAERLAIHWFLKGHDDCAH